VRSAGLVLALLAVGAAGAAGPSYTAAGIVNASSFSGPPFAPNSVISIFGAGLARSTQSAAAGVSLPLELNYVRVFVENQQVPILFVSDAQINFILSTAIKPGQVTIRVATEGLSGPEIAVPVVNCAPTFFPAPGGYALATDAAGKVLTADYPASPGDIIVIYMTGLGRTSPSFIAGEAPPGTARIVSSLKIALDGKELDPVYNKYAGVTPGSAGLYQLNLEIPRETGADPEIRVSGDAPASGLKLPIRPKLVESGQPSGPDPR